jgi:DeoR family transcriptional regulator of aga operon
VVADGSKLGRVAFARICGIDEVHELITDTDADPRELAAIRDAGLATSVV